MNGTIQPGNAIFTAVQPILNPLSLAIDAAFAAASIAKESGFKIGWTAVKIALPGWIVPFMAVYAPALMLQPVGPRVAEFGFAAFAAYMLSLIHISEPTRRTPIS